MVGSKDPANWSNELRERADSKPTGLLSVKKSVDASEQISGVEVMSGNNNHHEKKKIQENR
jgi:hypothetical protein